MILRFTSDQLRRLANQVDAYTQIQLAGGAISDLSGPLFLEDKKVAYLFWWEDERTFLCEFLDFEPGVRRG